MKTITPSEDVLAMIHSCEGALIFGHEDPDGDSVCSQLGLSLFLRRIGKEAFPVADLPFKRPEIERFSKDLYPYIPERLPEKTITVCLDSGAKSRLGVFADHVNRYPSLVIDHHSDGKPYGTVRFVDPKAPSVTYMILKLIEKMGYSVEKGEAELLMFGLATDTGFFRHLTDKTGKVFHAAAKLVNAGASPKKIYHMINGNRDLDSRLLLGHNLTSAQSHFDGKLIIAKQLAQAEKRFPKASKDSDILYQLLQTVSGVEAVVLIKEQLDGSCVIGFRSNNSIDVGAIASSFGGGGHAKASGATLGHPIDAVEKMVLHSFHEQFIQE
ncbi:MAG: DHH family phosphoesterase [Spirochaetia bacterium]